MRVIFTKDVRGVGRRGEIKEVSDGYARNFLLNNKSAEIASPENLAKLKKQQIESGKRADMSRAQALAVLKAVQDKGEHKMFAKANSKGVLFAALSRDQIASSLGIDPSFLNLEHPIKQLGVHELELSYEEIRSKIQLHLLSKDA